LVIGRRTHTAVDAEQDLAPRIADKETDEKLIESIEYFAIHHELIYLSRKELYDRPLAFLVENDNLSDESSPRSVAIAPATSQIDFPDIHVERRQDIRRRKHEAAGLWRIGIDRLLAAGLADRSDLKFGLHC